MFGWPMRCSKDKQFVKVHRLVMASINMLKFKCSVEGCKKTEMYELYIKHVKSCKGDIGPCIKQDCIDILN